MIQEDYESNSEHGRNRNFYLNEELWLTLLLVMTQSKKLWKKRQNAGEKSTPSKREFGPSTKEKRRFGSTLPGFRLHYSIGIYFSTDEFYFQYKQNMSSGVNQKVVGWSTKKGEREKEKEKKSPVHTVGKSFFFNHKSDVGARAFVLLHSIGIWTGRINWLW